MARQRAMSWRNFERIYKPTTDEVLEYHQVPAGIDYHNVWTLVQAEDTHLVTPGWHVVNRLGYYVTENPWTDAQDLDGLWVSW